MQHLHILHLLFFILPIRVSSLWYNPAIWRCGSFEIEELLLDSATLHCVRTDVLDAINEQCERHDNCYRARDGKDFCDNTFCHDAPEAVTRVANACIFSFCVPIVPPTCYGWVSAACAAVRLLGNQVYQDYPTTPFTINSDLLLVTPVPPVSPEGIVQNK